MGLDIEDQVEEIASRVVEEYLDNLDLGNYDFPYNWIPDIEKIVRDILKKTGLLEQNKVKE